MSSDKNTEPSMDEILSSIRKIIADDTPGARPPQIGGVPLPPAVKTEFATSSGVPPPPRPPVLKPPAVDDVLDELTQDIKPARAAPPAPKPATADENTGSSWPFSRKSPVVTSETKAPPSPPPAPERSLPSAPASLARGSDVAEKSDKRPGADFGTFVPSRTDALPTGATRPEPLPHERLPDPSFGRAPRQADGLLGNLLPSSARGASAPSEKAVADATGARSTGQTPPPTPSDGRDDGSAMTGVSPDSATAKAVPTKSTAGETPAPLGNAPEAPEKPSPAASTASSLPPSPQASQSTVRNGAVVEAKVGGSVSGSADGREAGKPAETTVANAAAAGTTAPVAPTASASGGDKSTVHDAPPAKPATATAGTTVQSTQSRNLPGDRHSASQRTMEETVVDLLRPMLRQWLDANMPRILEKTLRAELTDDDKKKG